MDVHNEMYTVLKFEIKFERQRQNYTLLASAHWVPLSFQLLAIIRAKISTLPKNGFSGQLDLASDKAKQGKFDNN